MNSDASNTDEGAPSRSKDFKTPTRQASKCKGNKENGPLSSHRDPRRTPLLSRIPFTPTPNPKSAAAAASSARGKKDVTPAYAYKNAETGLLEIRTVIPPSLSMVANEDDTVVGLDDDADDEEQCNTKLALYPIALNGGGAGLYRDPREFANGNAAGFSNNHKTAGSRRAPLKSHVRFAWPYEIKKDAGGGGQQSKERDLETGLSQTLNDDDDDGDDRTHRTRQSIGTLATAINPWRMWENVHNEMSRLAGLREQRSEDEASHVTLARQRNKASRVSSVYNDDDFDFALVLAPHDAYAFWANHLDFREEALHLVDDQQGPEIEELDDDGQDDDSTIATATCEGAIPKKESKHHTIPASTPKTPINGSGLRRRKKTTPSSDSNHINSRFSAAKNTPASTGRHPSHRSPYRVPRTSERVFSQRKSLFERALDRFSPPGLSQRNLSSSNDDIREEDAFPTPSSGNKRPSMAQRRRWGNTYDGSKLSTPNLTSPPIVSLKRGSSTQKRSRSSNIFPWRVQGSGARGSRSDHGADKKADGERHSSTKKRNKRNRDDDEDLGLTRDCDDTFFASPGVPRGIGKLWVCVSPLPVTIDSSLAYI
ncbi:hypothetical protein ACHAXR_008426 [Thalassiosira sp. AJA248-18]